KPDTLFGALVYLALFLIVALVCSRVLRTVVHAALTRQGHIDRTTVSFMQQFGTALIWVIVLILYAHLIPVLRSMGTALLAGASIASVVIGLAAQSTLGNLVAGVSITIYRPFSLGDTIQVAAPTGTEIGVIEMISLGYTTLRTADGRLVVVPNALAASQVSIKLGSTFVPGPVTVAIRVNRDADLEGARQLALTVAAETVGENAVDGCFLIKVGALAAVLELRVHAPDAASRDTVRAKLLSALARRLTEPALAIGTERPSFS
ncbi:MAG TPA: mechanosensitive ion channel family protein, partial [Steroidobacteraceae bacterium]|nr:mechanosensitive ion channel family protein [Steroidobacteraceae bacterium]